MEVPGGEPDPLSRMVLGVTVRICSSYVGVGVNMTEDISQSPESSTQSGHWIEDGTQTH